MSSSSTRTGSDSSSWRQLEGLLEEYAERVRRGDAPSPESFAAEHPDHEDNLRTVLRGLAAVESASGAERLPAPERLGEYRIVREIARGGMGVVYEAVQESLGRRVALKTLPQLSERLRERFRREVQAAASLDHPGIVAVHAFGEANGRPWCAMQLVEGCGLDRVVRALRVHRGLEPAGVPDASASSIARWMEAGEIDPGPDSTGFEPRGLEPPRPESPRLESPRLESPRLESPRLESPRLESPGSESPGPTAASASGDAPGPAERTSADRYWRQVARIGLQIADALAFAHGRGVLHRDVKPSNLLVEGDGRVRVADFGLCKLADAETLSATGEVLGTLRYMAVEQLQGNADVRTDVHGLGLCLYELATLRPGYAADERSKLFGELLYGFPPRPRQLDRAIPADLETIILKAIAKLPEERYGTAAALADDLRAFLEGRSIAARPPSAVYLVRLALRRWRVPVALIAVTLAVLAAGALFYVVGLQRAERSRARQAYVAQLAAAQAALSTGEVALARRSLEQTPEHLRRWEWSHLRMRLNESRRVVWQSDEQPFALALSPDGERLAVATSLRVVLLDTAEPAETVGPVGPVGPAGPVEVDRVSSEAWLAWGPAGQRLLIGDWSGRLRVADVSGVEPAVVARDMASPVRGVAFGPRGERVAAAVRDGSIHVLTARLDRELAVLRGHSGNVDRVAFTHDGTGLLSASWDGSLRLWNLAEGSARVLDAAGDSLRTLALAPAGERWAAGSSEGLASTGDLLTGARDRTLAGHRGAVREVAFDPSGRFLATSSADRTLRLWDVAEGLEVDVLHGHQSTVGGLDFHPDGRRLFSASEAGDVLEWDLLGPRGDALLRGHQGDVWALAYAPDGRRLASGSSDTTVRVWDVATRRLWRVLTGPRGTPQALAVLSDGQRLLAGCSDGSLWLWELERGRVELSIADGRAAVSGCALLEPGRVLVTRLDGSIEELLLADGNLRPVRRIETRELRHLAVAPDGARVALGTAEGRIVLQGARDARPLGALEGHVGAVMGLAFSPDGRRLASVGLDRTLRLWDVERGAPAGWESVVALEAGSITPSHLAFHPDGTRLVTSAHDGSLRLWDVATGGLLLTLQAHDPWANRVLFDPTGRHLASGGSAGGLRLWSSDEARTDVTALGAEALERARAERVEAWIAELGSPRAVLEHLQADAALDAEERDALLALTGERLGSREAMLAVARGVAAAPGRSRDDYEHQSDIALGIYRRLGRDGEAVAAYGMLAYRLGELGRARQWLERGVQEPAVARDPLAQALLAMTLADLGEADRAREHLALAAASLAAPDQSAILAEARAVVAAAEQGGDDGGR